VKVCDIKKVTKIDLLTSPMHQSNQPKLAADDRHKFSSLQNWIIEIGKRNQTLTQNHENQTKTDLIDFLFSH
jgi:hypothetical protein